MSETVKSAAKKPETKRENKASQTPEICPSQSISSQAEQILLLQRSIGNQAVQRLIRSRDLQAKLRIGQPGDKYEQEADRVAEQVMSMPEQRILKETQTQNHRESGEFQNAYAKSRAPVGILQRLYQPIVQTAPATAISIRTFISLVKAEERKWPAAEQTQTALMITRLRKIFYGTSGWDEYLILGAKGISSGYNISEEETGRENLTMPAGPDADIVRKRQVVKDASGRSPAIASQQEVRLEDGTFADIGHVFTGLDAANNPAAVSAPLGVATATDNKAAVTWTGDLGSVLAEIIFKQFNTGTVSPADMQSIINEYASPQDMLGDIDSYVMADLYDISNRGGKKVSELLRAYYLSAASTPDGRAREHRYSRFCALTGLTGWSGGAFANEAAWINRWAPEVGATAALYIGANTEGKLAIPGRLGMILGIQLNPFSRTLLKLFLDALKARVAAEPP